MAAAVQVARLESSASSAEAVAGARNNTIAINRSQATAFYESLVGTARDFEQMKSELWLDRDMDLVQLGIKYDCVELLDHLAGPE